ncbi:MAG: hypothetical protein JRE70_19605 [Deltaproteobacteria bacterium]|nr:hypothetical protein [Deltaproteobacteria bacterium]
MRKNVAHRCWEPAGNGGLLHPSQTFPPAIPEAREQHPEDAIDGTKSGAMSAVNKARKLMAQCNVLGDEIGTILEDNRRQQSRELVGA